MNFRDLHPHVLTDWGHGLTVFADWIFYWRQSLQAGLFRPWNANQAIWK